MKHRGTLEEDGTEFDVAFRFDFTLGAGEVIKGWDKGIDGMRVGGKRSSYPVGWATGKRITAGNTAKRHLVFDAEPSP